MQAEMENPTSNLPADPKPSLLYRAMADENGATAIEYALIAAGIGVAVAATVYSLGTKVNSLFQSVANAF